MMAAALLAITATPSLANTFHQKAPGDAAQPAAGTADTALRRSRRPRRPVRLEVRALPRPGRDPLVVTASTSCPTRATARRSCSSTPTAPRPASTTSRFPRPLFPNEPQPQVRRVYHRTTRATAPPRQRHRQARRCAADELGRRGDARHRVGLRDGAARAHRAVAVPPAETVGVQGLPNLFKAMCGRDRQLPRRDRLLEELRPTF